MSRRGVTLIEVAVAVVVFTIILLGMFSALDAAQKAERLTREQQAASLAAFKQLDLALATPDLDAVVTSWNNKAFHVPYQRGTNLIAASTPLNPDPNADKAGRVEVIWLDRDGDARPDDYDADGRPDSLEVRVTIAWRGSDNRDQKLEVVGRRTR